jgi:hypothetical protein
MKVHGAVDVEVHAFLTSALVVGEWSASRPGRFTLRERNPVCGPQSVAGLDM